MSVQFPKCVCPYAIALNPLYLGTPVAFKLLVIIKYLLTENFINRVDYEIKLHFECFVTKLV